MGCDGPGIKSQCNILQTYYNQNHKTRCQHYDKLRCSKGWRRYHKYRGSCFPGWVHSCCSPDMPLHSSSVDFQCCSGQLIGDKTKGVCHVDSCPYSDYCNQYMEGVCPNQAALSNWLSKGKNCGTYIANAPPGAVAATKSILSGAMESQFPVPYKKGIMTNPASFFSQKLKLAKTYCPMIPGACDKALGNFCHTVTREDVTKSPDLLSLCGCFMQPGQYPYNGIVDTNCSMTCNGQGVIKPKGWNCKQTVCIIDNVDINMVNSEGNVNLNQLCGSTGDSVCLLKDIDINAVNSRVGGGGVTINQQCTRCYKWSGDPTGRIPDDVLMQHPGFETPEGYVPGPGWTSTPCGVGGSFQYNKKWVLYGGIAFLILGLVLLAFLLMSL